MSEVLTGLRGLVSVAMFLLAMGWALLSDAAVGRTEMQSSVDAGGSARFGVPIRMTEGIAGMTPRLAVSHSGPGLNSILGVGFGIAGLSMIAPCRRTIAQDGQAAPVKLAAGDRYCLDGARLRAVSGTYGATNAQYRTEVDQLARITSLSSADGIPGWFRVETRDGLTLEYGNSVDSKLLASTLSGQKPMFWALSKVSDRGGNSITYHYDTDQAQRRFRPSYILYTASNGGAARYRVQFVYQTADRPDPTLEVTPSNQQAATRIDTRLLARIELQHDGINYRKYQFTYEAGAGANSRLKTIQECAVVSGTDDCLPATTLGWQSASSGYGAPTASGTAASVPIPLDLNGDGFGDLVWAESGTWRYRLGSASGFGSTQNSGITATNPAKAMPLDWNGDGRMDLLVNWSDGFFRVLAGTATGLASPVPAGPTAVPSNTANSTWVTADINGDGRDDLVRVLVYGSISVRLNGSSGFGAEVFAYADGSFYAAGVNATHGSSRFRTLDYDGDGTDEVAVDACLYIYEGEYEGCAGNYKWIFRWNGTALELVDLLAAGGPLTLYGDVNADGQTDIAWRNATGLWCFAMGSLAADYCGPSAGSYSGSLALVTDHDGDGYDDLYLSHTSSATWHVFRSTGTGLASTPIQTGISTASAAWLVTDFNGDGLADLVRRTGAGAVSTLTRLGLPGETLSGAVDGFGNQVAFAYLPMSNPTVYTKGSGATYPMQDVQSSWPLVRTVTITPVGGTAHTLTYSYANARRHLQGRGFLGMGSRTVTDSRNGIHTTETYRQDFPFVGAMATATTRQPPGQGNHVITSVADSYLKHDLSTTQYNERYLPYLSQSVRELREVGGPKNSLLITSETHTQTVDTLGNVTLTNSTVTDQDLASPHYGQSWTRSVSTSYSADQTQWCLSLPTSRTETRGVPGQSNESRNTTWAVSGPLCRITQETIEPGQGSALSLVTDLGYDSCGNVNSVSSYPAGQSSLARATTLNYGTRCQRPETITNPLNQMSTVIYNYALGVPTTQMDPNGLALLNEYDGFGRLTRIRRPDQTATRIARTACSSGNSWCGKGASSLRYQVTATERTTTDSIIRTEEQFYDGLDRLRFTHSDSLESGPAMVQVQYDWFGRPTQRSQPYFGGGTLYWTTYSYDLLGRLTQETAAAGQSPATPRSTSYAYEGRDTRITDPRGHVTVRTADVAGLLRRVIDPSPGGTTVYGYKPFGELASITDAAGNISSWSHNLRGFVTQTVDPDAGTWTYVPNAFGETTHLRDARTASPNWTTQFTYDKLGRPQTRIEAEGTTYFNWGYSSAARNIGQLESVSSPGPYAENYSYDSLGRLSQQQVTADGTTYTINQTYQATTGYRATLEYPVSTSGYRLKLAYDYQNGILQRIRDANGSTHFWTLTSTNPFGQPQNETYGSGVSAYTEYDPASGWMLRRQAGVGGGTGLVDATLTWDTAGNLLSRQDLKQSVTETFVYDTLNRLTTSQRNGAQNLTLTYDAIGNILTKSDVGSYTYHATKKRAVTQAGSTSYGYDANGNMTSRGGSSISYTSYNLPSLINAGSETSALHYGAFRNRFKQVTAGASPETRIYVAGLMEKVTRGGVTEYRYQIGGPTGTVAIYTRRTDGSTPTYYLLRDHLGSPKLITNTAGVPTVKLSFSAYGERRGSNWSGTPSGGEWNAIAFTTRDGFTEHEHLDNVGLVHMNGRVYDPKIGRFLSPDPFIDWGLGTQGVNRYGYVGNNPLNRIDPSGYSCQALPGMSDEEAAAEISRCADEFDAGGWGPNNGNQSKWCDLLGDCRVSLGDSILGFGVTTRDGSDRDSGYTASMLSPNMQNALDQYNARFERRVTLEIGCGGETGLGCGDWGESILVRQAAPEWRQVGVLVERGGSVETRSGPIRVTPFDASAAPHIQQFEFVATVRPVGRPGPWISPVYRRAAITGFWGTLGTPYYFLGDDSAEAWIWTFAILPHHPNCGNCGRPGLRIHEYGW
jgi:RHS repeat-associated protein